MGELKKLGYKKATSLKTLVCLNTSLIANRINSTTSADPSRLVSILIRSFLNKYL